MVSESKRKTIEKTVRELVLEDGNRAVAEKLLAAWIDNYRFTSEALGRSTRNLLLLILLFTMLATASLSDTTIFGMEFDHPGVPMVLSYLVAGFMLYRVVGLFVFSQMVEEAIRECYYQFYTSWQTTGLTDLADYPSFTQIESALENIEDSQTVFKIATQSFLYPLLFLLVFACLGWFIWAGRALVSHDEVSRTASIGTVVFVAVLVLRAIIVAVQGGMRIAS